MAASRVAAFMLHFRCPFPPLRTPRRAKLSMRRITTLAVALFLIGCSSIVQVRSAEEETGENSIDLLFDALDTEDGILPEGLDVDLEDDEYGQEEEVSLEDFLEEEMEFFKSRDEDGSGGLTLHEFKAHFLQSLAEAGQLHPDPDTGEIPDVTPKPLDDEDEKHAEWAFREFDLNADGSITWEEWHSMMFHEEPQEPEYVDGSPSKKAEEAHLTSLFREWDGDQDGNLNKTEIVGMFRSHRRDAEGRENTEPITNDEIEMVTWQVLDDKDSNRDQQLSLEEWLDGGAYF